MTTAACRDAHERDRDGRREAARWDRLARYARWRARRLRLLDLPDDLLHHVASYLTSDDVARLVDALAGVAHPPASRHHVAAVPEPLRCTWILHHVHHRLCAHIYALAELGLYWVRGAEVVHAMVDWSPFTSPGARVVPSPVGEFRWAAQPMPRRLVPSRRAAVQLNAHAIHDVVRRALTRHTPCVHVALYRIAPRRHHSIIWPHPLHAECVQLYPACLL